MKTFNEVVEIIFGLKKKTLGMVMCLLYIWKETQRTGNELVRITLDGFYNGVKVGGERVDNGTGLTPPTIITGLKRLQELGLIESSDSELEDDWYYGCCAKCHKFL